MNRPYIDTVTSNIGRLLLTDELCSSFVGRIADVIGATKEDLRDDVLYDSLSWKALLMMTLVVALVEG